MSVVEVNVTRRQVTVEVARGGAVATETSQAAAVAQAAAESLRNGALKTGAFTAEAARRYLFDSSAGSFTATLPDAADFIGGESIDFEDVAGACLANPVTLARNGATIAGAAADFAFNAPYGAARFTWSGSTWLYRRT